MPGYRFALTTPPDFNFMATVLSHGWVYLAPFAWDQNELTIPLSVGKKMAMVRFGVSKSARLTASTHEKLRAGAVQRITEAATWIFRLDEDLSFLATVAARDPLVKVALRHGAGRLLRAPTVWEEAVRVLCTVNVNWSGTVGMMRRLVDIGGGFFPSPELIAGLSELELGKRTRMGYRVGSLRKLAQRIAGGYDIERWKAAPPSYDELRAEILSWPGFGPYAAAHMLVQLGFYHALPIDSEVRAFHTEVYGGLSDAEIKKMYDPFGSHAFLVYKLRRIAMRKNWIGD